MSPPEEAIMSNRSSTSTSPATQTPYAHLPFNAFWEQGYKDMGVSTMGGPNHDIVELRAALPPRARVLDLGCGEGRNAFFLAGSGCRVTAVDRSESGIQKLRALAHREDVLLEAVVEDIVTFPITGRWDLIMAHGVIDYLDNAVWRRLLGTIKEHTAPGGFNAYTCMLFTDEYPAGPEFTAAGFKHSLAQGELAAFYSDWSIVRHDRYVKWDQHPPRIPLHCHPVDKVVAQRPAEPGERGPVFRTEEIPVGPVTMPRALFDTLDMGLPAAELLARCGQPAVVDTYTMDGAQLGVGTDLVVNGYNLSLWYYGRAAIYVVNGRVWGRALYDSAPVRVRY
jgi:tellurite methyltransferase